MGHWIEGLVVNPDKKKKSSKTTRKKVRKNPTKVMEVRKPTRGGTSRKVGLLIIKNPTRDRQALLMLASGTALGLAGGKLIDRYVVSQMESLRNLSQTVPVGDSIMLLGGLALLKNSSQRNREFALGVVAGAGAKLTLNLIDKFVFKGQGTVGLYGEEVGDELAEYDDETLPAEYEEADAEPYALPEPDEVSEDSYEEEEAYDELGEEEEEPVEVDVI